MSLTRQSSGETAFMHRFVRAFTSRLMISTLFSWTDSFLFSYPGSVNGQISHHACTLKDRPIRIRACVASIYLLRTCKWIFFDKYDKQLGVSIFRVNFVITWPQGYKTFFMLNSAEHEICPSNTSQITNISIFFLLNIAEHEHFSASKYENLFAEKISCSAELSMKNVL